MAQPTTQGRIGILWPQRTALNLVERSSVEAGLADTFLLKFLLISKNLMCGIINGCLFITWTSSPSILQTSLPGWSSASSYQMEQGWYVAVTACLYLERWLYLVRMGWIQSLGHWYYCLIELSHQLRPGCKRRVSFKEIGRILKTYTFSSWSSETTFWAKRCVCFKEIGQILKTYAFSLHNVLVSHNLRIFKLVSQGTPRS